MQTNAIPITVGLLAIVWFANAPAADFCVDDVNALQGILDTAASNGEDDHVMLVQGGYSLSDALTYTSGESRELRVSGGWVGICMGRGSSPFTTTLSRLSAGRLLEIDAGPAGTVEIDGLLFLGGSDGTGGGVLIEDTGEVLFERNVFIDNEATLFGSAVSVEGGDRIRFLNNLFTGNDGSRVVSVRQAAGTGVYFIGNTVVENTAMSGDSASVHLDVDGTSSVLVANNIIWDNVGNDLNLALSSGDIFYWHNDVEDYSGPNVGINNLSVDPGFVPILHVYELAPTSPLIDMGIEPPDPLPIPTPFEDNWWVGAIDILGGNRVEGLTVDMGAFELPDIIFVDAFGGD